MRTIGLIFLGIILCYFTIIGIWRTAYDWETRLPNQLETAGLESEVAIQWGEYNTAEIHAHSFSDALLGLGYVQGTLNAWTIALWRQAALGKLSEWYGAEAVEADRLVQILGLPENAQRARNNMNSNEAHLLQSFAKGIQLAWEDADHVHEFFLQNITPEPWEPWHTIVIERLIAWLSVPPDSVCNLGESVCTGSVKLDSMILVHGLESSSAWVLSTPQGPLLYQRHILGKAIPPAFMEVTLKVEEEFEVHGASLIGTPFFPAGKTNTHAWSILLHSPKAVQPAIVHGHGRQLRFSFDDREEIIFYHRSDTSFSTQGGQKMLFWSGLGAQSDIGAWFAVIRNRPTAFQLWRGDGILVSSDTSWAVLGEPEFVFPINSSGFVISNDSSAKTSSYYLSSVDVEAADPLKWITDTRSPWVASTLPSALDSLQIPSDAPDLIQLALNYLENWNHSFDEQSIGATIYNEWIKSEGATQEIAFANAVNRLSIKFGPDQNQWLWGRVHTDRRRFTLHGRPDSRLHAPLDFPVNGHESTMLWGGAQAADAPATWEGWTWLAPDQPQFVRKQHMNLHQTFGRYISSQSGSSVFLLPAPYLTTTILMPYD